MNLTAKSMLRPRQAWKILMLVSILSFGLVGCGKKGPLYLPDDTEQATQASDKPAQQP